MEQSDRRPAPPATRIAASRWHEIAVGHRVYGHESKCAHLHGHNYVVHAVCVAESLDAVGRVIDFSVIKDRFCAWLEAEWDHRFLLWNKDPIAPHLAAIDPTIVVVPFNPTAENMALHLLTVVAPRVFEGTGVSVTRVVVQETGRCSAAAEGGI